MEEAKLWGEYKKDNCRNLRNILINNYIPLVKIVAGRLKSTLSAGSVEMDDLVSYGIFGLIDAIDKFNIDKNIKFETYAQMRIRGAIIDHLRKNDWAPRSLRHRAKKIENAYKDLEYKYSRTPTDDEVAEYIGMDKETFFKALGDIGALSVLSLEELLENRMEAKTLPSGAENRNTHVKQPDELLEYKETKRLLREAVKKLPEREKLIVTLYYYEGLTYKEIGKVLNVSESRISQLHTRAVLRMKNCLSVHRADLII